MALQFVSAQTFLCGFVFGCAHDHGFVGSRKSVLQQGHSRRLFKVFDDVTQKNQVVVGQTLHQHCRIACMNPVVEILMHRGEIGGVTFDPLDADLPVLSLIARRIMFSLQNVGVFAKQMTPLAEAHAHIKDGTRLQLAHQVNHRRNRVGPAAGHGGSTEREDDQALILHQQTKSRAQLSVKFAIMKRLAWLSMPP